MALIKCKDCGNNVSTDAKNCPKCGAKITQPTSKTTWVIGAIVLSMIFIGLSKSPSNSQPPTPIPAKPQETPAETIKLQTERKEFIQKLLNKGVFQKVEIPSHLPHLWVKPAFYMLDFDSKSKFVSIVYAYYFTQNSSYNIVVIFDSLSGKEIGDYSPVSGGLTIK